MMYTCVLAYRLPDAQPVLHKLESKQCPTGDAFHAPGMTLSCTRHHQCLSCIRHNSIIIIIRLHLLLCLQWEEEDWSQEDCTQV